MGHGYASRTFVFIRIGTTAIVGFTWGTRIEQGVDAEKVQTFNTVSNSSAVCSAEAKVFEGGLSQFGGMCTVVPRRLYCCNQQVS